jgi:hypothetical protein
MNSAKTRPKTAFLFIIPCLWAKIRKKTASLGLYSAHKKGKTVGQRIASDGFIKSWYSVSLDRSTDISPRPSG